MSLTQASPRAALMSTPQRAYASLDRDRHVLCLPVALDRHGDGVARAVAAHVADELFRAGDFLPFDGEDHVPDSQPGDGGPRPGGDLLDFGADVGVGADGGGGGFDGDAEHAVGG